MDEWVVDGWVRVDGWRMGKVKVLCLRPRPETKPKDSVSLLLLP